MSYRRDPSAPRLALLLLALLLGFGSATVPAWSLDARPSDSISISGEAFRSLASRLGELLGLWAADGTVADPSASGAPGSSGDGTGGSGDAGVIIDPNGPPKP